MKLKVYLIIFLIISSGIFYYNLTSIQRQTALVIEVIDGDTIKLENGLTARLKGINAPEKSMMFYNQAKTFLEKIRNKKVELELHGTDRYGRLLVYVYFKNKLINSEIVRNGLAHIYYYEKDSHYDELKKAEEFARRNHLGIWKKSPHDYCIELVEFKHSPSEKEKIVLKNKCNFDINVLIKDDATHIYREKLKANSEWEKNFTKIWNADGDTLYIWEDESSAVNNSKLKNQNNGLILFYRY